MAKKILVEIELPEGKSLEEILRGVSYRVVSRVEERRKVLEKYVGILGEAKSEELDEIAQEAWKA